MNTNGSCAFVEEISKFWYDNEWDLRYNLVIEPGRAIVEDTAKFFVKVTDIKRHGDLNIAIVDTSQGGCKGIFADGPLRGQSVL